VLAVLGVLARRPGPKMSAIDWEKRLKAMPGNAPPKWMFRNITAIRENTDRILQLLEPGQSGPARQAPPPPGTDPAPGTSRAWAWKLGPPAEGRTR
jgi:hypothetical protein